MQKNESFKSPSRKRSRAQVCLEILQICEDGAQKTKVVYGCNLNFRTANIYLEALIKDQALSLADGVYTTTPKGLDVIADLEAIKNEIAGIF